MSEVKDTKIVHLADDIQKVQVKKNFFISEYGSKGAFHLAREIIQNCFDECLDEDSPGNQIEITYDRETDMLRSEDNGRGFPETDVTLNDIVTTLQSGSKFFRNAGTASAGEFGVNISVAI